MSDDDVKKALRELGEPICYAMETEKDRRNRLNALTSGSKPQKPLSNVKSG